MLKIIGGIAMGLMVPVLSAYIAESIGKRPALVPGFVAGMIAIQGLPINPNTGMIDAGGAGVGFGFLGGIVGGFLGRLCSSLVLRSSLQVFQRTLMV